MKTYTLLTVGKRPCEAVGRFNSEAGAAAYAHTVLGWEEGRDYLVIPYRTAERPVVVEGQANA